MLKVDTILAIFRWIVSALNYVEQHHAELADKQQGIIDAAIAAKALATTEAKRASQASTKIKALLA